MNKEWSSKEHFRVYCNSKFDGKADLQANNFVKSSPDGLSTILLGPLLQCVSKRTVMWIPCLLFISCTRIHVHVFSNVFDVSFYMLVQPAHAYYRSLCSSHIQTTQPTQFSVRTQWSLALGLSRHTFSEREERRKSGVKKIAAWKLLIAHNSELQEGASLWPCGAFFERRTIFSHFTLSRREWTKKAKLQSGLFYRICYTCMCTCILVLALACAHAWRCLFWAILGA